MLSPTKTRREGLEDIYRELCLRGNVFPNGAMCGLIQGLSSVRTWDFRRTLLSEEAFGPVIQLIGIAPVCTLEFTDCNLPSNVCESLLASLRSHPHLTSLHMRGNVLTKAAFRLLLELVGTNKNVVHAAVDPAPMCSVAKVEYLCKINQTRAAGAAGAVTPASLMVLPAASPRGQQLPRCASCNATVDASAHDHTQWLIEALDALYPKFGKHALPVVWMTLRVASLPRVTAGLCVCSATCATRWVAKIAYDYGIYWDATLRLTVARSEAMEYQPPPCLWCGASAHPTECNVGIVIKTVRSKLHRSAASLTPSEVTQFFDFVINKMFANRSEANLSVTQGITSLFGVSGDTLYVTLCSERCCRKASKCAMFDVVRFPCELLAAGTQTPNGTPNTRPHQGVAGPAAAVLERAMRVGIDKHGLDRAVDARVAGWGCELRTVVAACLEGLVPIGGAVRYRPSHAKPIATVADLARQLSRAAEYRTETQPLVGLKLRLEWVQRIRARSPEGPPTLPYNSPSDGCGALGVVLEYSDDAFLVEVLGVKIRVTSVYVAKCLAKYGAVAFTFAETPSYHGPLTMTPSLVEYSYALNNLTSVETAVLLLLTMPRDGLSTTAHMMTSYGVWAQPSRHLLDGVDPSLWPPSLLRPVLQSLRTRSYGRILFWLKSLRPKQLAFIVRLATQCFAGKTALPFHAPDLQPPRSRDTDVPTVSAVRRVVHTLEVKAVHTNVPHEWCSDDNVCVIHFAQQRENSNPAYGPGSYFGLEFATPTAVVDIVLESSRESGLDNVLGVPWMHRSAWEVSLSDNGHAFTVVASLASHMTRVGFHGAHSFWRLRYVPYDKSGAYIPHPVGAPTRTVATFHTVETDAALTQCSVMWSTAMNAYVVFDRSRWGVLGAAMRIKRSDSDLWRPFGGVELRCAVVLNADVALLLSKDVVYYVCRHSGVFLQCPTLRGSDEFMSRLPCPFNTVVDAALPLDFTGTNILFSGGLYVVVNIATGKVSRATLPLSAVGIPFTSVDYVYFPDGETEASISKGSFTIVRGQASLAASIGSITSKPGVPVGADFTRAMPWERLEPCAMALEGFGSTAECAATHAVHSNGTPEGGGQFSFDASPSLLPLVLYEYVSCVRMVGIELRSKTFSNTAVKVEYSADDAESWHCVTVLVLRPGAAVAWWPDAPSCKLWRIVCAEPQGYRLTLLKVAWFSDLRIMMPSRVLSETMSASVPSSGQHPGPLEYTFPRLTSVCGVNIFGPARTVTIEVFDEEWIAIGTFDARDGPLQWSPVTATRMRIRADSAVLNAEWKTMPVVQTKSAKGVRCFAQIRFRVRGEPVLWEVHCRVGGRSAVVARVAQGELEEAVDVAWPPTYGDGWELKTSTSMAVTPAVAWFAPLSPSVCAIASQGDSMEVGFESSLGIFQHVSSGLRVATSETLPLVVAHRDTIAPCRSGESLWCPRPMRDISVHFSGHRRKHFDRNVAWLEPRYPSSSSVLDGCAKIEADDFNKKITVDSAMVPSRHISAGKSLTFTMRPEPMAALGVDVVWSGTVHDVVLEISRGPTTNQLDIVTRVILSGENECVSAFWKPEGAHAVWRVHCLSVGSDVAKDVLIEFQWRVASHSVPNNVPTPPSACTVTSNLPGWTSAFPVVWKSNMAAKSGSVTFASFDYRTASREHTVVKVHFRNATADQTPTFAVEGSRDGTEWVTVGIHAQDTDVSTSEWHSHGHLRFWRLSAVTNFEGDLLRVEWFGVVESSINSPVVSWASLTARHLIRDTVQRRHVSRPGVKRTVNYSTFDRMYAALSNGGTLLQDLLASIDTSVNGDLKLLAELVGTFSTKNSVVSSGRSAKSGLPVLSVDGEVFDALLDGKVPAGTPTRLALHWDIHSHDVPSHSVVAMVIFDLPIDLLGAVCAHLHIDWTAPANAALQDRGLVVLSTAAFHFSDTHTFPPLTPPSKRWTINSGGIPYAVARGANVLNSGDMTTIELLAFAPSETRLLRVVNAEGLHVSFRSQRNMASLVMDRVSSTICHGRISLSGIVRWQPALIDFDVTFDASLKWDGDHQCYVIGGTSTATAADPFGWVGTRATSFELFAEVNVLADGFVVRNLRVQCTVWFTGACPMSCCVLHDDDSASVRAVRLSSPRLLPHTVVAFLSVVAPSSLSWFPQGIEFHALEATMCPEDTSRTLWLRAAVRMLHKTTLCEGYCNVGTTICWKSLGPSRIVPIGETILLQDVHWAMDSRSALVLTGTYAFLGVTCPTVVTLNADGTHIEIRFDFCDHGAPPLVVTGVGIGHANSVADWDLRAAVPPDLAGVLERTLRGAPFLSQAEGLLHPDLTFRLLPFGFASPNASPMLRCSGNFCGFPFDVHTPLAASIGTVVDSLECLIGKLCFGTFV